MKLKNILLFTVPVALAAFVYLGDVIGISEVVAKTVKQIVKIETKGAPEGEERFPEGHEFFDNKKEHRIGDYIYEFKTIMRVDQPSAPSEEYAVYKKYKITITETETEVEVPDDANASKVVPAVDPEAEEVRRREAAAIEEQNAKRREEAAIEVQKAAEKKTEDFTKEITTSIEQAIKNPTLQTSQNNSDSVENAVIKTDYFTCFTQDMIDLLAANPDLNYEIHYRYKGKRYVVVIPAGTDYSKLEASNGYYGFRYLDSIFGGYEEGTK